MPNFGDEEQRLAFPINAEVTGPATPPLRGFPPIPDFNATNSFTSQPGVYYNPPGYIILEPAVHVKNRQGNANLSEFTWLPPNTTETLKIETLESDLQAKAKWFYAAYMGDGNLKAKFDKIKAAYSRTSSYDQGFRAQAHAKAGIAQTAKYEANVYANLLFVGLERDSNTITDDLLRGKTFEKKFSLKEVKDHIGFRGSNYLIEGDFLRGNDKNGNHNQPSFYYDIVNLPVGTEVSFSAKMRTERSLQRVGLVVVWELPINQNNGTEPFNYNDNWLIQSTTYTKKEHDTAIRVEVYWHDHEEIDTILDLNECVVSVKKVF
ncbi:hypothetical protein COE82_18435 [Bacillus wiedmannii]|uniref:hypothetical protein n=1 Tax=Bacillus cereus group TaxID=86661 RepID=UPI000BFD279E|nr:hypothetical protein [Bacillus wiedmannii]PHB39291.1 hypothetical protein COE82_18435 [Bacillus wiedmannii]